MRPGGGLERRLGFDVVGMIIAHGLKPPSTMILILSASLSDESNSRILAGEAQAVLSAEGHSVDFVDLRELPLPFCDGGPAYSHPGVSRLRDHIKGAEAIIVATPIYNYDASAALKNAIELTGKAWENKVVGFLCAAGGQGSYMSIMALASSLMLDFRTVIVPRFVYATEAAFADGHITDKEVADRVADLARTTLRFGRSLKG